MTNDLKVTLPTISDYLKEETLSNLKENEKNLSLMLGRIGKDPKLKKTKNNNLVCDFSLAVDSDDDNPRWINVNVWGKLGAKLEKELKKGDSVFVNGSLRESTYTDRAGFRRRAEELTVKQIGKVY